ncbi:MAG: hypothetical protein ABIC57_01230 [bacterium]
MDEFKSFECIIEISSDWGEIEFIGSQLFKPEVTILEGYTQHINIKDNKISFMVPQQLLNVPDNRGKIAIFYLRVKLTCLIEGEETITSIIIEKGDCGKVDIEIDKHHYENSLNLPNDCRNKKLIELPTIGNVVPVENIVVTVEKKEEKKPKPQLTVYPTILIVTPTKNDAHYLERHCKTWENVDYPRDKIRWIWMCGESDDNTLTLLNNYFSNGKWKCEIYAEPKFDNLTGNAMWIADVVNAARNIYNNEDFVVLCDSDIVKISPSLLKEVVELDLDIVAPYVWHDGRERDFFDTYVFRELDGTRYPVRNVPHMNSKEPVELASVGTMLLIKGEIFKSVKFENPCPNLQFCKNARKKGYKIWAVPWITILHADVGKEGRRENHDAPEDFVKKGVLPKSILEKLR